MRNPVSVILAVVLCLTVVRSASGQVAQSHPDFSGTWVVDGEKTALAAGQPGRSFPRVQVTIVQDAKSLTTISAAGAKIVYPLDGTAVTIHAFSDTPDFVHKSVWEGARIVTAMSGGGDARIKETRSMEGQWMVVETVRKTATGETTGKLYYAKVPKK
jgi:hypothetical protein